MKRSVLILVLLIATALAAQAADTLGTMAMPQLANPFYDFFSRNYLGVEAAGRGYTGTSIPSSAQGAMLNPAAMTVDSANVFLEANIKPPLDADGLSFDSRYSSPVPLTIFGFGFHLHDKLAAALFYNNPKSIILDDFSIEINQGDQLITRFPSYYLHQLTGSVAYHASPKMHLGLSLHNQIHYLDDVLFIRSYDRIRDYKYSLRIQPGIIYGDDHWGAGVSAVLPTKINWDLRYAEYETTLPLEVSAGVHYAFDTYRLAGDVRYRQDSEISPAFDDHISVHLGAEKRMENNIYRLGYFYSSDVFSGLIRIPENTTGNADTLSIFWDDVNPILPIKDTTQHFLSIGFGHLFRDGSLNVSVMHAFASKQAQTQVNLSLSLYLSSFKRKDFLFYE